MGVDADFTVFRAVGASLESGSVLVAWPNQDFDPPAHLASGAAGYPARWWMIEAEYEKAELADMAGGEIRSGDLKLFLFVQAGAGDWKAGTELDTARTAVAAQSIDTCTFLAGLPEYYGQQSVIGFGESDLATEWGAWCISFPFIAQN